LGGNNGPSSRCSDFAVIRARLEELRRERAQLAADKKSGSVSAARGEPATTSKPGLLPAIRRAIILAR
jgi:hypothetical protein